LVRPGTRQDPAAPVTAQVAPPGEAVTVYEVGVPPDPAATVTVADPLCFTAVGVSGGPGIVLSGVTEPESDEAALVPEALVAVVVKVYAVPLVRPGTRQDPAAPVTVQVAPPGDAMTVYDVGAVPLPAATVTVAPPLRGTAVGAGGVPGIVDKGVVPVDGAEAPLVPDPLVATVVKTYWVPLVRPVIRHEPAAALTVQVAPPGVAVTVCESGAPPTPAATVMVADPS